MSVRFHSACISAVQRSPLTFIKKVNGSNHNLLVSDDSGHLWILKVFEHWAPSNVLANEFVGSTLCNALGLPMAPHHVMLVDDAFFEDERTWCFDSAGYQRPRGGLHFASRFLPQFVRRLGFHDLPPALESSLLGLDLCLGMFIFDVWALHADKRQAIFSLDEATFMPTFIDNGHLFGGPDWCFRSTRIDGNLVQRTALQRYSIDGSAGVWIRRMQASFPGLLERVLGCVPETWYQSDSRELSTLLQQRLQILPLLLARSMGVLRARVQHLYQH